MQHIFLAHTPLQIFSAKQLSPILGGEKSIFHQSINNSEYTFPEQLFSHSQAVSYIPKWRISNTSYKRIEEAAQIIKSHAKPYNTKIYLSDLHWFLNNRIFFDRELSQSCEFYLYDEGMGYYTENTNSLKKITGDFVKAALGRFGLGPSVLSPYLGHLCGWEHPRVKAVYAFSPEHTTCKAKPVLQIPKPNALVDRRSHGKLLFLQQQLTTNTKNMEWQSLCNDTITALKGLSADITIKIHHHYPQTELMDIYQKEGFKVIQTTQSAEEIIANEPYSMLASYCSAALVNVRNFYPDVDCISIGLNRAHNAGFIKSKTYESFLDIYKKMGVKLI